MPRAVDRNNPDPTNDPTRSGTEFHVADLAVGLVELLAEIIPQAIENMKQAIVDFIKETIGIDLSSPELFLVSVVEFITTGGPDLAETVLGLISEFIGLGPVQDLLSSLLGAFDGIDLSDPGSILTAIANAITDALEDVPILGDIVEAITGVLGGGLPDLSDWASQVPLLDIITGFLSGSTIPGLDASKIVSGIFNLGQLPSTVLNTITGVAGSLINSILGASFIPGLDASKITTGSFAQSQITGLVSALTSFLTGSSPLNAANLFGLVASLIPGLDASKITSGNFAQSIVTGLTGSLTVLTDTAQDIVDGIVNSLTGAIGSLWPQAQADAALKAQADAIAAAAAALAQLQGNNNQSNTGGINALVDFTTFSNSTSLPSVFTETYIGPGTTGRYGVASGRGATTVSEAGSNSMSFVGEYNVVDTLTDYQRVGAVWAGSPGISYQNPTPTFLPLPWWNPYRAENTLFCRYKDVNNWVRVRFLPGDTVGTSPVAILESRVSGTITQLSSVGHAFQPNTAYWLEAGTAGSVRTYRVLAGTTAILTYTDPGSTTQVGAAFRGGAVGGFLVGAQGAGTPANPSELLYFTLQDNNPAGNFIGKQARWYRANTGGVAGSNGTPGMLPNNLLDTVDFNVGNIFTFAGGSNCRVTVSQKGRYEVTFHAGLGGFTDHIDYLWKNGSIVKRGDRYTAETHSVWSIDLNANDYINVGDHMVGSQTYIGDAAGTLMYLEIRQVLGVQ